MIMELFDMEQFVRFIPLLCEIKMCDLCTLIIQPVIRNQSACQSISEGVIYCGHEE